jgi:hypothetical protein
MSDWLEALPNARANARLIAAAPALLAALEACVADLTEWRMYAQEAHEVSEAETEKVFNVASDAEAETARVLEVARAAIARARGISEECEAEQARRG